MKAGWKCWAFNKYAAGGGRRSGIHWTSMHSMDDDNVRKLIPPVAESGVTVMDKLLIDIMIQRRYDTSERRGMTRVPELMAAVSTSP